MSRHNKANIYDLTICISCSIVLLGEIAMGRNKDKATRNKADFDQGLKCLAHLIAQVYLRKEKERLAEEKTIQEDRYGTR